MATTLKAIASGNTDVAANWQEVATTAIVSCSNTNTLITLSGDVTWIYTAGVKFTLVGTVGGLNDGTYEVSSSTVNSGNTDITPTSAPAADEGSETGTSSINRVPTSSDEIDLNGNSMVQAGGAFACTSMVDSSGMGYFEITNDFTCSGSLTDVALYCNSTVSTISISSWIYSGSGSAFSVGSSGNISSISTGWTYVLDMTSSTGCAIANNNGGSIGYIYVDIANGSSSSEYMIKNTGTITTISGYVQAQYGIHNNGGTIGDISNTSYNFYCSEIGIYNESGTISDITGSIFGTSGTDKTVWNKGTITTINGRIDNSTDGTYALYNDGGTIGNISGQGIFNGTTDSYAIYNTDDGTIGNAKVEMSSNATYGVYIDSGSIGDVTITNNSSDNPSYGFYNAGCSTFGYLTINGSATYGTSIYNTVSDITYTGAVSGSYSKGFENFGSPTDVIVDVDFSGTASEADVYWDNGTGEFSGTSTGGGGSYGAVYVNGGTFTYSVDITTSGSYGLYLDYSASGTFNGTVTNNGSGIGVVNYTYNTIDTNITNTSSGIGYQHNAAGGYYSGTLTNTGSGDAIQIYGSNNYLDEISGQVISTNGTPVNGGVKKISGTVSYTTGVSDLSGSNIIQGKTILGKAGSYQLTEDTIAYQLAKDKSDVIGHRAAIKSGTEKRIVAVGYNQYSGGCTIMYSNDGLIWINGGASVGSSLSAVGTNGSRYVAINASDNVLYYSDDAITWTVCTGDTFGGSGTFGAVAWNGTQWVAMAGTKILYSSNGINWTLATTIPSNTALYSLCWNGTYWVAGGSGTTPLMYSSDGNTWTACTTPRLVSCFGIAWNGTIFVAVGNAGTHSIATSSDGITWTGVTQSVFTGGRCVAWNGSKWVVGAFSSSSNYLAYSSDGTNWTGKGQTYLSGTGCRSIVWDGVRFIAVADTNSKTAYSADGVNWTNNNLPTDRNHLYNIRSICSSVSPTLTPALNGLETITILGEEGTLVSGGETSHTFS